MPHSLSCRFPHLRCLRRLFTTPGLVYPSGGPNGHDAEPASSNPDTSIHVRHTRNDRTKEQPIGACRTLKNRKKMELMTREKFTTAFTKDPNIYGVIIAWSDEQQSPSGGQWPPAPGTVTHFRWKKRAKTRPKTLSGSPFYFPGGSA